MTGGNQFGACSCGYGSGGGSGVRLASGQLPADGGCVAAAIKKTQKVGGFFPPVKLNGRIEKWTCQKNRQMRQVWPFFHIQDTVFTSTQRNLDIHVPLHIINISVLVSYGCVLFVQTPVMFSCFLFCFFRHKPCHFFFKAKRYETAAAYCRLRTIKTAAVQMRLIRLFSSDGRRQRQQVLKELYATFSLLDSRKNKLCRVHN